MLSDGSEREYFARLVRYERARDGSDELVAVFEILYERAAADPETRITLFQCLPKQGKMENIIQKSTELGVSRIVPVVSERSVPAPRDAGARVSRWRRIAEAACKQSGRGSVPEVADFVYIAGVPAAASGSVMIFPYEGERVTSIKSVLRALAAGGCESRQLDVIREGVAAEVRRSAEVGAFDIAVVIGPEGGFAEHEAAALVCAGARACSLGRTILRTETAGPAAIAMIVYELELDRKPAVAR
jgi:16S rRNA (uracil1498-N3)-methyltransferase